MTFHELADKTVINTVTCKSAGNIVDCTIDTLCGKIVTLTAQKRAGFLGLKRENCVFPYENIERFGDDIIFVNICETVV